MILDIMLLTAECLRSQTGRRTDIFVSYLRIVIRSVVYSIVPKVNPRLISLLWHVHPARTSLSSSRGPNVNIVPVPHIAAVLLKGRKITVGLKSRSLRYRESSVSMPYRIIKPTANAPQAVGPPILSSPTHYIPPEPPWSSRPALLPPRFWSSTPTRC